MDIKNFRNAALRHNILIREVVLEKNAATENLLFAACIELANCGFRVVPDQLKGASSNELTRILESVRSVAGKDRDMVPTYPQFPKGVQEMSTLALIWEQLMYYWTGGVLMPDHPLTEPRTGLSLEDMARNAREVRVLTADEAAQEMIASLVKGSVAMSDDDRTLLEEAVRYSGYDLEDVAQVFGKVKNFENEQALVLASYVHDNHSNSDWVVTLAPKARTLDSLLRLVLAVSTEPVKGMEEAYQTAVRNLLTSNVYAVRFNNLSRAARKALVARIGDLSNNFYADNLVKRQEMWQRMMRMVHPFDLKNNSVASVRALNIVHNNGEYRTLNSYVEEALEKGDVKKVISLEVDNNNFGDLMNRVVAILRKVSNDSQAQALADTLAENGASVPMTTLIGSYNGIIAANFDGQRITRMAGQNNVMREAGEKVEERHLKMVKHGMETAIRAKLVDSPAPQGVVNVLSEEPVPLVRRDLSASDRYVDRGARIPVEGEGNTIRLFCHWENNQSHPGYVDIAGVLMDKDFNVLAVSTWNSWMNNRVWSTYSGDKHVYPGHSAAEYFDVDMEKVRKVYPKAAWVALTLISFSNLPLDKMPILCGAMLRSEPNSGEVFDPRTVVAAFQPSTKAMMTMPVAYNMETGEMVWVDSDNGSTDKYMSAASESGLGDILRDEISRPRMTIGELAKLWAQAHGAKMANKPANKDEILSLLK